MTTLVDTISEGILRRLIAATLEVAKWAGGASIDAEESAKWMQRLLNRATCRRDGHDYTDAQLDVIVCVRCGRVAWTDDTWPAWAAGFAGPVPTRGPQYTTKAEVARFRREREARIPPWLRPKLRRVAEGWREDTSVRAEQRQ